MIWTDEEVSAARGATPGLQHVTHFNSAGCSLPTQQTLDAVIGYLNSEATIGGYETFDASSEALDRPYTALASLLNCSPEEIAIVTSATEAWQQVIYGLAATWTPGDRILTSLCEYGSNYISYLQLQKRYGIKIEVIPETQDRDLDVTALEALLQTSLDSNRIVLVSINHIPTSSGRMYNIEAVGKLTRQYNVPFLLDACQSIGQVPVDIKAVQCDFLSGTGRKYLRGPRGSGFLYCSRETFSRFEPATLDNTGAMWVSEDSYELGNTARRFESYEMSFAAKVGLGVAVQQCNEIGIEKIWDRVQYLAGKLRKALTKVDSVTVHDVGANLCGLVTFTKEGLTADAVQKHLFEQKINTSVSRVPSSRLDFEERGLTAVVRASVHYFNTEKEIEELVEAVERIFM